MSRRPDGGARDIDAAAAESLLREGTVRVLDVRTPEEFEQLGHIPGATLLPVDLIAVAPATIARDGAPLLVCCEYGVRSAHAARFLERAGFEGVLNLRGGMAAWRGPREHRPGSPFEVGPCSWLLANVDLLPRGGRTLDVACGAGRHALLLAAAGLPVRAIDNDAARLQALAATAARLGLPVQAETIDLEAGEVDLGEGRYDVILVIHYLHRPLFPAILRALAPGGLLLYETFTIDQARHGRPTNPEFLLRHGELPRLVQGLEILRQREGEFEGRCVAAVAARKSSAG